MKIIKKLICLLLIVVLTGCTSTQPKIFVEVFTLETCGGCQAFKQYAVPALEDEFKSEINIKYYDLDFKQDNEYYQDTISKLIDFNDVYAFKTPLIVVNQEFALLGYNRGEETELILDIQRMLKKEPLGDTLSQGRWLLNKEE